MATLDGWREPDVAFCASFMGYVHAAFELSGAAEVAATHAVCAARGAPRCVYTIRWW
jgi:hypothetical protein